MIDPDELLKLKAAVGMFHLEGDTIHAMSGRVAHIFPHNPRAQENAAFIVAACNNAAEYAEEVKTLRKALEILVEYQLPVFSCLDCPARETCDKSDRPCMAIVIEHAEREARKCLKP